MIRRRSPVSYFVSLAAMFAIVMVNVLGLGHFHADSKAGGEPSNSVVSHAGLFHDHAMGGGEPHDDHERPGDIGQGCDFCWLQGVAKASSLPPSQVVIAPASAGAVLIQAPVFPHRSFLDAYSFLVRGPPGFSAQ